ncbi:hypothetical protein B0H14DRAFT_2956987, partial [Mycena olivaceomarginata]
MRTAPAALTPPSTQTDQPVGQKMYLYLYLRPGLYRLHLSRSSSYIVSRTVGCFFYMVMISRIYIHRCMPGYISLVPYILCRVLYIISLVSL